MDSIHVSKINEAYIRVEAERGILMELHAFFTFFVPGAQFSPKFKAKIWDGNIRLFSLQNQSLYYGLYSYIQQFAKERGYEVTFDDTVLLKNNFSLKEGSDYATALNLRAGGKPIVTRDYQLLSFVKAIRNKRQLILSPTSSGKSLIDYLISRYLIDQEKTGLIIVPTTQLVEQLFSDFQDYSTENKWDVEANVHRIYSGKDKHTNKPLTISTWQSIYTQAPEFFEDVDFVLGEEAHTCKAKSLVGIMTNLVNAEYRIGLTGTLDGTKTHAYVLEGLFGPVKKVISTKELMDRKEAAELTIKCPILRYPEEVCKMVKDYDYNDEIKFLNGCKARNKFIRNLALSLKGNTLILFRHVETHGQIIYEAIKEKIGNKKVFFIYGGTDVDIREQIRKLAETENDVIIVASIGVFSMGINIKNLNNLIFAIGAKSKVRIFQSIGRILRTSESKVDATLFDIVDDLRYKKYENFSLGHFKERVKMYQDEGFKYKLYPIEIKV